MPCKPSTLCSLLLPYQKKKVESCLAHVVEPQHLPPKKNVALSKATRRLRTSEASSSSSSKAGVVDETLTDGDARGSVSEKSNHKHGENTNKPVRRSSSRVHRDFLRTTAGASYGFFTSLQGLPRREEVFSRFQSTYPRYSETRVFDDLRHQEYAHLEEDEATTCLDYCGFGLLSQVQQWEVESGSSLSTTAASFNMMEISANLWSHALFGVPSQGTMEAGLRKRVMQFLNIPDAEYSMVFTASRGSTFKLLADAYPWEASGSLITMYDYESESVGWMEQRARERGASAYRARFRWPSLRVCSRELKKELTSGYRKKRKVQQDSGSWLERLSSRQQHQSEKERMKGLFVYPAQSRVSGAKYSYQWMALAQQNNWHVLLDASALGPKDMDSLGLSLFRPDFITASFYRLFGSDPSGFGCLFIKNSVAKSIQDPSGAPVSGMVRIIPFSSVYSTASGSVSLESEEDEAHNMSSFSGPMKFSSNFFNSHHLPETIEENESSAYEDNASVGAISRSPVFSEDGNEPAFYTDGGPSPLGSASEEHINGLIQEPANSHTFSRMLYGKRDLVNSCPASSICIKGLYSGLLHRHAGRVGNSGESTDEEDQIQLPQSPDLSKRPEYKDLGSSVFKEMRSTNSETKDNQFKEHVADCVVMILRKDQSESGDVTLGFTIKRPEKSLFNVIDSDYLQQGAEDTPEEKLKVGGLESIAEMEVEVDRSNEQGSLESDRSLSRGANDRPWAEISWNQKENAIRRETEGDFRLLGRRGDLFSIGKTSSGDLHDALFLNSVDSGGTETEHNSETRSEDGSKQVISEPYLLCRSLDHADMLGLNKTSLRLRYLINWLISSMLRLQHAENDLFLVKIYGPQVRYDRGASVAFNLFDNRGKMLHPELIRLLADHANIAIGLGFLKNISFGDCHANADVPSVFDINCNGQQKKQMALPTRVEVVTAALGLLSDFKDVHKLWVFLAKFLDPDFLSRECVRCQLSGQYSDG